MEDLKMKKLRADLPRDKDIRSEYDRLIDLYSGVKIEDLSRAAKLISRAAFLAVTIDRLEKDISENGYEDSYKNGENQFGKKESAAAKLHVSYTKNYLAVTKQLNDMLLKGQQDESGDAFDEF